MKKDKFVFFCPNDGLVKTDFVGFLCNKCGPEDMIEIDGRFVCKQCLEPSAKFECRFCGSTEVKMKVTQKDTVSPTS